MYNVASVRLMSSKTIALFAPGSYQQVTPSPRLDVLRDGPQINRLAADPHRFFRGPFLAHVPDIGDHPRARLQLPPQYRAQLAVDLRPQEQGHYARFGKVA